MPRTFVLGADAPATGRVLHYYANGSAVVEASTTADVPGEPVSAAGQLRLPTEPGQSALDAARRSISDARGRPVPEDEPDVAAYVEFVAPPDPRWLAEVQGKGVTVLAYQPDNSYLVRGRRSVLAELADAVRTSEGDAAIRSVVELTKALKPAPETLAEAGETTVVVLAATSDERPRVLAALRDVPGVEVLSGAGNDVLDAQRIRVRARVSAPGVEALLALPHVLSIESFGPATPEDEIAGLVVAGQIDQQGRPVGSYDRWLAEHHVDGAGAVIGIVDGGVNIDHPAFAGRIRDLADGRKDWHATMVAGHAAGSYRAERDPDGFTYGLGAAPAANLLSQDLTRSARELCGQTVAQAGSAIAIQNNSWGRRPQANPMDYGSDEALYDALVRNARDGNGPPAPLTICFSSGNSGSAGLTRPKAAKNVIVTGNSENYRPDVGAADSDDIRDVYTGAHASSHGNCADGRIRPHVVAPGEWTASASHDVFPGEPDFVSPMIMWGGGSSGASPKTAGACALLANWWRRWHGGANPSPAMLQALVVNGAEPIDTGGPAPNNVQGWGRLSLRELLDPAVARIALDQADLLTGAGDARRWAVRVVDPRRPVKITLAWTDPPGAVGSGTATASPIVNRLALRAQDGGRMWRGGADRFRGGWTSDDAALTGARLRDEGVDNLQCVFLRAGETRSLVVSVTALAVTTDALTGRYDRPQQDFALVLTNAEIDHSAGPTTVVTGVADSPRPADEDAWWAAGEPLGPSDPDRTDETLRAAATTLEATGNSFDMAPAGSVASVAEALRDRLAVDGAAVLGMPAGIVVTTADVDAVRALAGAADVHLVSDDSDLLGHVASAIGPHTRVRYRLGALPETLRDTALAAAGLQELVLGGDRATVHFGIVPSDGTLVVALPAETTDVSVRRPGRQDADAGARTVKHSDRTELIVERAGETPGAWTVQATVEPGSATPPTAWVQGGADLAVSAVDVAPGKRLLRVAAPPGSLLRQLSMPRSRLNATPGTAPEADRPLVVRVRPSRLHRIEAGITPEAAADSVPVPALGHVVAVPADTAVVLDVPLDVVGTDHDGVAFARRVHASMVADLRLNAKESPPLRIMGHIDEVRFRDGSVAGVRVTDGLHARELRVRDSSLGAAVARIDRGHLVELGVRGAELEWVFLAFPDD